MYWTTTEEAYRKCWLYLKSMEKFNIPKENWHPYGIGRSYCGSTAMRSLGQMEFLKQVSGNFTHVLCTDAWDVLFTAPYTEPMEKYAAMGHPPMLIAAGKREGGIFNMMGTGEPYYDLFDIDKPYPFPSTFHMGEIPFILDRLERMNKAVPNTHDESLMYAEAFRNGLLDKSMLDTGCCIFQEKGHLLEVKDGRLYNAATDSYPCVAHMADGWTSQETGKDHIVEPWAKRLEII